MKWCEHCKVHVDTERKICPLCFNLLTIETEEEHFSSYPKRKTSEKKTSFWYRLLIFISIVAILASVIVNLATHKDGHTWWSLYVVVGVLYLFSLARGTLYARINVSKKLLFQEIVVSLLLIAIDVLSGNKGWALAIVVPAVCVATNTAFISIVLTNRKNLGDSFIAVFLSIILGCVPFLLQLFGVIKWKVLWAPLSSCGYSGVILLGFLIFGWQEITEELKKRLHI